MTTVKRLIPLIIKEFLTLLRDPKGRFVLIMPIFVQLAVFSFAATLEVKNVDLAVLNKDAGKHSTEIIQRLDGSTTFSGITFINNTEDMKTLLDQQKVIAALYIPQDFSADLERGEKANIQILLDGRKSNAAQIVNSYITLIISKYGQEILAHSNKKIPSAIIITRNRYNNNLLYLWFTVPSLVGVLALLITMLVSSLSVARERELGTFEQLLVSPLMPCEILIGKLIPAVLIGMAEGLLIFAAAVLIFGIPFTGSFTLLLISMFAFIMSIVGVGLFISSLSRTQQQAILGTFVFLVPAITLSGFASPTENMPEWLQIANQINPLKHFLITVKGLFLKDMPANEIWTNTWPLLIIGALTLGIAGWFFGRRLE